MSFYRNAVWFVKGVQEYTKDSNVLIFLLSCATRPPTSFSTLGVVHTIVRNLHFLSNFSHGINVHIHIVDMSSARQVWAFAQSFSENNQLHVLINNAGCMVNQRELTEEGLEKNFATNTLGTYILTTALIPALKKVEDPRVITVSSGGMLTQKLNVSDLQFEKGSFDGTMAYAQNKRQQVILTERWASQHKEIHFSSMHPGWADTPAVQSSMPSFHAKMQSKLRTEAMGADTVVWLAVSAAAIKQPSGLFFQDRKPVATHLPLAYSRGSPQDEEQLLTALEEFAQKFKP
uniref:Dehydrogenase/reductase (SDR family) member 12 n=2 Tax=Cyprinodon variegatus TaxID=28743 RepID=A0A3Q2DHC0_CYPVA